MTSTHTLPNSNHEEEEEEDCLLALQLASSAVLPMAFQTAIELQVLEIISKAGSGAYLSPKEIASQLPTQNPEAPSMLGRIMRLLAAYSLLTSTVVTCDNGLVERKYGLAPVSKYFVSNQAGVSFSPIMFLIQDKVFMDSWYHLKDAVLEGGIPFNLAHGMHAFQYPGIDLRFNDVFNRAMSNITTMVMKMILEIYKGFESLKELVDVGGGVGTSLSMITAKYPKIKGINFDLPHVIERAPSFPGVKHVGGDMFNSVPKGEAIFMKLILHDWSDEHCLKLLKNCYHALPSNGKLIVVDAILPITPENNSFTKCVYQSDLIMMTQNPGGKERTEKEFEAMALAIGFAGIRKICCVSSNWVMEFFK